MKVGSSHGHWDFLKRTQDKYPFHKIMSHTFPFDQINEV